MKWLDRFIPHSRQANEVKEASEVEVLEAEHEQAIVLNQALQATATRQQVEAINQRNGFSVALGHAFAKRGPA